MTVSMDNTSDDHSPPLSENAGSTWLNWENEISSISGLNLDSTSELNGLVEDKEVAARAVALVVNSTRKGIVPLCADIANLLRAKQSLEKKVYLLKREVEALRSSTSVSFRTSHSASPTPPLVDKTMIVDQCVHAQERSRPCSRCSQCSSNVSNSAKLDGVTNTKIYLSSPTVSRDALRKMSPRMLRQSTFKVYKTPTNGGIPAANPSLSHPCETNAAIQASVSPAIQEADQSVRRKNSLPEMTCEPAMEIPRISPKISKEIQCNMPLNGEALQCNACLKGESPIEDQFLETVHLNAKQAEELGSARKEIEILKGRLKELEMNQLARECTQNDYRCESQHEEMPISHNTDELIAKDPHSSKNSINSKNKRIRTNGLSGWKSQSSNKLPPPPGSLMYAEPLYGCKCTACEEAMGSEIHAALSATLNEDLQKFPINSKVLVQLGDHVVTKGEKTGRIRYIGHLDKIGQPNMVFVGLELDAPVGRHDGFCNNKRYFFCQRDHGIFLPFHDIICKVGTKTVNCREKRVDKGKWNSNPFTSFARSTAPDIKDNGGEEIVLLSQTHRQSKNRESCGSAEDHV